MLELAEKYEVEYLVVMAFKPDRNNQRQSLPDRYQMENLAEEINCYKGSVKVVVENCYSQMRALVGKTFWGNLNLGFYRGCMAGKSSYSIALDGSYTPCRHLEIKEKWDNLKDYWTNSEVLQKLRTMEETMEEPCTYCIYSKNCLPCAAVNYGQKKRIYMSDVYCPLAGI